MPLLHGANLRVLLAGAAFAHLSSPATTPASSPCAPPPPPPSRVRAFASYRSSPPPPPPPPQPSSPSPSRALASAASACEQGAKPAICTADELHYVPVPPGARRGWRWILVVDSVLAWFVQAPKRNHPLMLLSGVATNAIGFDLSPGDSDKRFSSCAFIAASFARHMSMQGFDTWVVEVRGAGLSMRGSELAVADTTSDMSPSSALDKITTQKLNDAGPAKDDSTCLAQNFEVPVVEDKFEVSVVEEKDVIESNTSEEPQLVTKLSNTLARLGDTFSGYVKDSRLRSIVDGFFSQVSELVPDASLTSSLEEVSERILGLLELPQTSAISDQISHLSQRLVNILGEGQQNISPRLFGWQERLSATIEDLQKQLELIISYDWDFDHYLEEDVPAAMNYIKQQNPTKDGKLLAIGHSMGGILLYAMVSKCGCEGAEPELAAIVTLASSVDYTTSNSSLKLLLPLADPAEMLRVPAIPLGTLLSTTYPISSRAPYILSLLRSQISSKDMMAPELLSKLVLNNFCTVPAKVLLQLTTAFRDGGLRNRAGTFFFKQHLHKIKVPVLALAGDEDLICPPEAVYETVKLIPQHLVTYKVFGKPEGPHYAHYDLVGGRKAVHEVYPCIIEFLSQHDEVSS
uniref:AB hydrolase-1 domain-containing protein n=1 Tax=Oryza punctata TaxID=4537 RepID=A0A0E0JMQ8_ORYPU